MLLAIDVGNTNIVICIFKENDILNKFRIETDLNKNRLEYENLIKKILEDKKIKIEDIKDSVISSVVPYITEILDKCMYNLINKKALIVDNEIKTKITINTDNPKEVGADRIVDALAAYILYKGPVMVIDFGTATTYDVVDENGVFEIGITSPGIKICADAFWKNTAKLPEIEIKKPDTILAKNTITSMQAGLVYGYIGQTKYIINEVKKELGYNFKVVATGGLARIIIDEIDDIIYDEDLTIKGIKFIYDINK